MFDWLKNLKTKLEDIVIFFLLEKPYNHAIFYDLGDIGTARYSDKTTLLFLFSLHLLLFRISEIFKK